MMMMTRLLVLIDAIQVFTLAIFSAISLEVRVLQSVMAMCPIIYTMQLNVCYGKSLLCKAADGISGSFATFSS
jgi:hypothetical protein